MLAFTAYFMIILFLVLVCSKKMSAFTGLIIAAVAGGIVACIATGSPLTDIFDWIRGGLFYTTTQMVP